MIMSIASSIVWLASDYYCGIRYSNLSMAVWDTLVVRAGAFSITAIAIAKLHESIEKQNILSIELGKAFWYLKRVKVIMPICSVCGKAKDKNCYLDLLGGSPSAQANLQVSTILRIVETPF